MNLNVHDVLRKVVVIIQENIKMLKKEIGYDLKLLSFLKKKH
jgi:hypothetical protein